MWTWLDTCCRNVNIAHILHTNENISVVCRNVNHQHSILVHYSQRSQNNFLAQILLLLSLQITKVKLHIDIFKDFSLVSGTFLFANFLCCCFQAICPLGYNWRVNWTIGLIHKCCLSERHLKNERETRKSYLWFKSMWPPLISSENVFVNQDCPWFKNTFLFYCH